MCCIFHETDSVKKAIFILFGKGLRAERARQDETWESLLEFADSDVDLASHECYFFSAFAVPPIFLHYTDWICLDSDYK